MTSLKVNIIQLEEGISDNAIVYTHTPQIVRYVA